MSTPSCLGRLAVARHYRPLAVVVIVLDRALVPDCSLVRVLVVLAVVVWLDLVVAYLCLVYVANVYTIAQSGFGLYQRVLR